MSFDWAEFLEFAKNLQSAPEKPGPPEAALRSATSRAYYAAFHAACAFARTQGWNRLGSGEDHVRVQQYFYNQRGARDRQQVGLDLGRLRKWRRAADYESTFDVRTTPLLSVAVSKSIIEAINVLSKRP